MQQGNNRIITFCCNEFFIKFIVIILIISVACGCILGTGVLDDDNSNINQWLSIICGSVSLICDIIIIINAWIFAVIQEYSHLFIVCFAIFNMIRNIVIISLNVQVLANVKIAQTKYSTFCKLQAFLINFAGLSVFWLMSLIAIIIMVSLSQNRNSCSNYIRNEMAQFVGPQRKKIMTKIMCFNFIICFIFSSLPFITDSYGANGSTCTILKEDDYDKIMRFISYYMHVIIAEFLCIFAVFYRWYIQTCRPAASPIAVVINANDRVQRSWNKFKTYPPVLLLAFLVPLIRRTMTEYIEIESDDIPFIVLMHRMTAGLFGFYLFLFYGRFGKCVKILFCEEDDDNVNNQENDGNDGNNGNALPAEIDNEDRRNVDQLLSPLEVQQTETSLTGNNRDATNTDNKENSVKVYSHKDSNQQEIGIKHQISKPEPSGLYPQLS